MATAVSDRDLSGGARAWSPPRVAAPQRRAPQTVVGVERVATVPPVRLPASTYRRRRVVAAGLAVVLVLCLWAAVGTLGGGPLAAPERPNSSASALRPGDTYVVQPGDTFWSIVQRLRPQADPRPLVDRLVAFRGGTTLYVGERITLPAG
ncbi:MAG: LysM peptidoglycan-binding domain-containing protein [Actinomycetota bacterium]|nr:LysM peptidoglycan-binding domain-containing protein [Actinomycetota bacterium]